MLMARGTLVSLETELSGEKQVCVTLRKTIEQVTVDRDAYVKDIQRQKLLQTGSEEEVEQIQLEITQRQKMIVELESKLRTQQNLLEAVKADRNAYNKQLIAQKDEMVEQKRKFQGISHRIHQVKVEIGEKDKELVSEHFKLQRVNQEIQDLTRMVDNVSGRIAAKEANIKVQADQLQKLSAIIAEADVETKAQTKQYNAIINEQRVLNQQLIERNAELVQLYDKLKLQHSLLKLGELTYKEKVAAVRQQQRLRDDALQQLQNFTGDEGEFDLMKTTTIALEDQLVQEKLRVKALEGELKQPINIHRWRQLKDTDTERFEMIENVQKLQREIIAKTDEVVQKDTVIHEKEKLYVDLRKVLARQPGPEASEQLRVFALTLKEKKGKYDAMNAELKMYQAKVYEYKYDIEKINQDLELTKLTYFAHRRQQQQSQQQSQQRSGQASGLASSMGFGPTPLGGDSRMSGMGSAGFQPSNATSPLGFGSAGTCSG